MIILIDMDGVIADFEKGFLNEWQKQYPNEKYISIEERRGERIIDQYPTHLKNNIKSMYNKEKFYLNLPVIPKAKEVVEYLNENHNIFICSSPMFTNPYSYIEKRLWLENNFSKDIARKLILTKDKTVVKGDVLIDDRASFSKGATKPEWKLLLFDTSSNKDIKDYERINWSNYKDILQKYL